VIKKPITPYQRLLGDAQNFANSVALRGKKQMWHYPANRLHEHWNLRDLAQRVAAADQLGYDVQIVNQEDGLYVYYVKKLPVRPWSFK